MAERTANTASTGRHRIDLPSVRSTVPGYARYIGRVGALAVVLGVGAAITTTPGIAWADDGEPAVTSDAGAGTTPSGPTPTGPVGPPAPVPTSNDSGQEPPAGGVGADDEPKNLSPSQTTEKVGDGVTISSSGGAVTSGEQNDDDEEDEEQSNSGTRKSGKDPRSATANGSAGRVTGGGSLVGVANVSPVGSRATVADKVVSGVSTEKSASGAVTTLRSLVPGVSSHPTVTQYSAADNAAATQRVSTTTTTEQVPATTPINLVLAAVLSPFLSTGPAGVPVDPPMAWVLLAAARRQIGAPQNAPESVNDQRVNSLNVEDTSAQTMAVVAAANNPPTAVADGPFTVVEDTPTTLTAAQLVGNDTDPDSGDNLSVNSVGGATNGTVVLNPNGTVTFTPNANYNGPASFVYRVKDQTGTTSTNVATVSLTVTPVNDAPIGEDDIFGVYKGVPTTFTAAQLVGNDTDPDSGDTLSINSVGGPSNGQVVLNPDGTVTFTPNAGFDGDASFIYRVKDQTGATSTTSTDAVVTLVVAQYGPPIAVDDGPFDTNEDTPITWQGYELYGNDEDPSRPYPVGIHSVGGAINGTVVINPDNSVTFTPTANYSGPASFTYKHITFADEVSDDATVSINVVAVTANQPPTAVNDGPFATNKNSAVTLTAAQLVGNDTDPNSGDTLSVNSVGGATNGTVVLNPNGTVTYTPNANYTGPASFVYRVKDQTGTTSTNVATVSLAVNATTNQAPTAVNDGPFTTNRNTAVTLTAAQLVGNDTDPNSGDTLSVNSVGGATNGTVVLNPNGTVTFTPAANYTGPASFVYRVKDQTGTTSTNVATVSLAVNAPTNQAPTAVNDGPFATNKNTAVTLTAAQLVGNDTDPNSGDVLSVNSVGGATNGTVVLNPNGTVTYTPAANYTGPASFVYRVKDQTGTTSTNVATVSLAVNGTVNQAPTAVNDGPFATNKNTAVTLTAAQLVGNDTDPNSGDTLSVNSVGGATNGTVVLNPNGTVTYTPNSNYTGPASFVYRVKDQTGTTSTNVATVNLTVNATGNQAPTAVNDAGGSTLEDTAKTFTAAQLVGNDTDPNSGDTLSVNSVGGATDGTVVLNANGTVTFTPNANYNGPASFVYRVKDQTGTASTNVATVNMTVTAVNDAPRAVADSFTIPQGVPRTFTAAELVGNDTDPDSGDTLSVNSVGGASEGQVVLNANGTVTFTPNAGYSGPASFIYRVKDQTGATSTTSTDATVSLTVSGGTNQAPTAVNDAGGNVVEDTAKTFTAAQLVGNDTDPNSGDTLTVHSVTGSTNGTAVLNGNGTVTFTPNANYNGGATFTYKVKDSAGLASANAATVTMTVTGVNDAPQGVNDNYVMTQGVARTFTVAELLGNDIDPDKPYGDILSVNSVGGNNHVNAVLNPNGTVTVTPEAGYTGPASFIYRVKDVSGATSGPSGTDATVTLSIQAAPAGTLTLVGPLTDNYKDEFEFPRTPERDLRTYMAFSGLQANGKEYKLVTEPAPGTKCTDSACHPNAGSQTVNVISTDGTKTGTVTMTSTSPNIQFKSFRVDGAVPAAGAPPRFGPLIQMFGPVQEAAPVNIDIILTVDGVQYKTTVTYKYEEDIYNAPPGNIENNGPGGRWWIGTTPTRLDHEAVPSV